MEKKKNRYEKPLLENLDLVGTGQGGDCDPNGSIAFGGCTPGGIASGNCSGGSTVT